MNVFTLQLPLEVSRKPLTKYLPKGVTLHRGDKLRIQLSFFNEQGKRLEPSGHIQFTGHSRGNILFQANEFTRTTEGCFISDLNLNTVQLLESDCKAAKVEVKFFEGDKQRTISFHVNLRPKTATGPAPDVVPAVYPEPEDILTKEEFRSLYKETVIQEKRVSAKNMQQGFIQLDHSPDDVVSVSIAGGPQQYGSYDPEDSSFEPDFYIDRNFTPSRLVWRRSWSDGKVFSLGETIEQGDKVVVLYSVKTDAPANN